jgi:hypothetical protein
MIGKFFFAERRLLSQLYRFANLRNSNKIRRDSRQGVLALNSRA